MGSIWEDFIDTIRDEGGKLAKEEVKGLIRNALEDTSPFLKRQGEKLERYLTQLAKGEITKKQLESYSQDIADLTKMHAIQMETIGKARAQRLAEGIENLVIKGLIAII